jgi:hypothetical protein
MPEIITKARNVAPFRGAWPDWRTREVQLLSQFDVQPRGGHQDIEELYRMNWQALDELWPTAGTPHPTRFR